VTRPCHCLCCASGPIGILSAGPDLVRRREWGAQVKNQAWVARVLLLPAVVLLFPGMSAGIATAQELAPRAYWPTPVGTRLVMTGYSLSTGDIVTDPSLPITGVDSQIHSMLVGYQQTFDVLGRTTNARIEFP
jgi:hypothetical protein